MDKHIHTHVHNIKSLLVQSSSLCYFYPEIKSSDFLKQIHMLGTIQQTKQKLTQSIQI